MKVLPNTVRFMFSFNKLFIMNNIHVQIMEITMFANLAMPSELQIEQNR